MPDEAQDIMKELLLLTQSIKTLQDNVIELSKRRKELALKARELGASTGSIAEACGLQRRSYPIRK